MVEGFGVSVSGLVTCCQHVTSLVGFSGATFIGFYWGYENFSPLPLATVEYTLFIKNQHHAINVRAVCGANLVTLHHEVAPMKPTRSTRGTILSDTMYQFNGFRK